MARILFCFIPAFAVMFALPAVSVADESGSTGIGPVFGTSSSSVATINEGPALPPSMFDGLSDRPRLYDNTVICTASTQSLAVGGRTTGGSPALRIRDWFTTHGGKVSGWDLYVINKNQENTITSLEFFEGTDSLNKGVSFNPARRFSGAGVPTLSKIPVHPDNANRPLKVSVDYDAPPTGTYTIYKSVPDGQGGWTWVLLVGPEELGTADTRSGFSLPAGNIGVGLRLADEQTLCASPPPPVPPGCGPVLAGGGEGAENGFWIINAELSGCTSGEQQLLCPSVSGYDATAPCTGGDTCNLDLPFHGIALTLYAGPGADELVPHPGNRVGNNTIADAQTIPTPAVGTGDIVTVHGFVGDNAMPSGAGTPFNLYDHDFDGDVDVQDFGDFQDCFGQAVVIGIGCGIHDLNVDGEITIADFDGFGSGGSLNCFTGQGGGINPACVGSIPPPPDLYSDIDVYKVTGLTAGHVLSALVEGSQSATEGPLGDPHLRIFANVGADAITELARSDDYERLSLDAFTTVVVPVGVNTLYIGVSSVENSNYDPEVPASITQAGPVGYALSVALTNPQAIQDNHSGGAGDCYETKHEPDDTIAQSITKGHTNIFSTVVGMLGDGAFGPLGQDVDIYMVDLGQQGLANTNSLRVNWRDPVFGGGFETVFDQVVALYNETGQLLACSDQVARSQVFLRDETPPALNENVDPGADKKYFIAVFGTDRVWSDENGDPLYPAFPPSLLNFPHSDAVAGTNESDLRPLVGGRPNRPGPRLSGPDPLDPNNTLYRQCYKIDIIDSLLPVQCFLCNQDPDEQIGPGGNDSLASASEAITIGSMLGTAPVTERRLGNGPYGTWQGDVDFYHINVTPGQVVSVNIGDLEQPPSTDNPVRSYLFAMDGDGEIISLQDYTLETRHFAGGTQRPFVNALASTLVFTPQVGSVYLGVGIDAGNLVRAENTPFDANNSGTTLSRRFETQTSYQTRRYGIAVAARNRAPALAQNVRMFIVPRRGFDADHIEWLRSGNTQSASTSFPRIQELNPSTGQTIKPLEGRPFFSTYQLDPNIPNAYRSTNPIIAYDGTHLFVSVDEVNIINQLTHRLFRMDPDTGAVSNLGTILALASNREILTGLVAIGTKLYALDSVTNEDPPVNTDELVSWTKTTSSPVVTRVALVAPAGEFNDVDGDLATDGTSIFAECSLNGQVVGICKFDTAGVFQQIIPNHVSNPNLAPGPRLGGFDIIRDSGQNTNIVIGADRTGLIMEMANLATGASMGGYEIPREFQVIKMTAYPHPN